MFCDPAYGERRSLSTTMLSMEPHQLGGARSGQRSRRSVPMRVPMIDHVWRVPRARAIRLPDRIEAGERLARRIAH